MYPNATRVAVGGRLELACVAELLDLEVAPGNVADRLLLLAVVLQPGEHPVGGEDEQARVVERHQEHQHVAMVALAAQLVRIHARGLVAVVPVRDQQLRIRQRGLKRGDLLGVGHAPQGVARALAVADLGERLACHGLGQASRWPRRRRRG